MSLLVMLLLVMLSLLEMLLLLLLLLLHRAAKTIAILPGGSACRLVCLFHYIFTVSLTTGLKTITNALFRSTRMLAEVMTLTLFCMSVFALIALQIYSGKLRQKCILTYPFNTR